MKVAQNALIGALFVAGLAVMPARAQSPYFLTYDHHLEEPGSLEISINSVAGSPKAGNRFLGSWVEFEYGAKAWWTTELYLDGQTTFGDGSVFTGWRWENRFRPLMGEHWINPVLYVEFEDINGADKTLKEVVGFDSGRDPIPNAEAQLEKLREIEAKLILSSNFKGWNVAENFIAEKNLGGGAWEFGYALAASRPLALAASPKNCSLCPENLTVGLELYGGLGDRHHLTLAGTSHYLAPAVAWNLPNGVTLKVEPAWGLTASSHRTLLRFGMSYEISGFGQKVRKLFSGKKPKGDGYAL